MPIARGDQILLVLKLAAAGVLLLVVLLVVALVHQNVQAGFGQALIVTVVPPQPAIVKMADMQKAVRTFGVRSCLGEICENVKMGSGLALPFLRTNIVD